MSKAFCQWVRALVLIQRVVGVGEAVVGSGFVEGLAQFARQHERPPVLGDGRVRVAGEVPQPAHALPGLEFEVAVAGLPGQIMEPVVVVGGLLVQALQPQGVAEADERVQLAGAVADGVAC
ncbi:MAG TPA: hypothetical protein VFC19_02915 [Candidatus Limnocylindrales bacterium]|nr:hypothetical protein [Candidatus Limnocylindrales bacterium]